MSSTMNTNDTVTLAVTGMSCGGCAGSVQRALVQHPGVRSAAVNLAQNDATVDFDPAATSPDALAQAVRSAGYQAALPVPGPGTEG